MNIGKASKLSGLTVKTVRYYSDIGIINPQIDTNTGYRDFSESDLAKLQFIAKARKFDFSQMIAESCFHFMKTQNAPKRLRL